MEGKPKLDTNSEPYADYERKDGLFLFQSEWDDLAAICVSYLQGSGNASRRNLAARILDAAQIDGSGGGE